MKTLLCVILGCIVVYLIGRLFAKGILHEIDNNFQRKFNHKKGKENGTETEK